MARVKVRGSVTSYWVDDNTGETRIGVTELVVSDYARNSVFEREKRFVPFSSKDFEAKKTPCEVLHSIGEYTFTLRPEFLGKIKHGMEVDCDVEIFSIRKPVWQRPRWGTMAELCFELVSIAPVMSSSGSAPSDSISGDVGSRTAGKR